MADVPQHDYHFKLVEFETVQEMRVVGQAAQWMAFLSCYEYNADFGMARMPEVPLDPSLIEQAHDYDNIKEKHVSADSFQSLASSVEGRLHDFPNSSVPIRLGIGLASLAAAYAVIGLCDEHELTRALQEAQSKLVSPDSLRTAKQLRSTIEAAKSKSARIIPFKKPLLYRETPPAA